MSKTVKIIGVILLIAGVAYGVYRWYSSKKEAKVVALTPVDKAA